MKLKKLLKETKGVFKPPVKKYYLGKLKHGCPYFWPMNFNSSIISIRKLKLRSKENYSDYIKDKPWLEKKFSNVPIVRRTKNWIVKIFSNYYYIAIGFPIIVHTNELGWKDKFNSPRFEWPPAFYIYIFKWQFCIWWNAPDKNNDLYYEMILQYLNYSNKDIVKAEQDWGWVDCETRLSTWNKDYLL